MFVSYSKDVYWLLWPTTPGNVKTVCVAWWVDGCVILELVFREQCSPLTKLNNALVEKHQGINMFDLLFGIQKTSKYFLSQCCLTFLSHIYFNYLICFKIVPAPKRPGR